MSCEEHPGSPFRGDIGELIAPGFSLDPFSGGSSNGKPIAGLADIAANLNRTGFDWYTNNGTVLADNTINFGFFNSVDDFEGTACINDDQTIAFNEFFNFQAMNAGQRDVARRAIGLWDDLVAPRFVETDVASADIRYGGTDTKGAQAYAYLPFGDIFNDRAGSGGFTNLQDIGGDVFFDYNVASNFAPLANSYYASLTLIHESGHALGLSHPGNYNATDDNNGDGVPDPITYADDAFYAQDSLQYTVMSYFDAYETGAQHIDWTLLNFAYASTPLVHDIAAIQRIYGADPTTRATNTTYGFNSTAGREVYDFTVNTRPIIAIYDAGGTDTIDFSGWNTASIINLNAGAFSSGGGTAQFLTLEQINANRAARGFAPRTAEVYDLYNELFRDPQGLTTGLFHDNIAIAYGTTIENARGGGGDDFIIANQVANRIVGGAGNDTVSYETATSGIQITMAGAAGETERSGGTSGAGGAAGDRLFSIENITGSQFADTIIGDSRDTLIGGSGDDRLDGGAAGDRLEGGVGNDLFAFTDVDGATDVIMDFARGLDRIDLSGIDAIVGTLADDAFSFVGSAVSSSHAGELRFSDGFVTGDVNGDGVADFSIQVAGIEGVLTVADFVL